jgi:hypothetical protein
VSAGLARARVGRDVHIVRETRDGLTLEGRARLRPGQALELVMPTANGQARGLRRVQVWTWEVASLGSDGLEYRGFCRWV